MIRLFVLIVIWLLCMVLQAQAITFSACDFDSGDTVQYMLYNKTTSTWVQGSWTATGVTEVAATDGPVCKTAAYSPTAGSEYLFFWKCSSCTPARYGQEAINSLQTWIDATITSRSNGSGVTLASSQHVIVDSGTITTLTNLPAVPTDWLTAAAVKADAVTKIQTGLSTYAGGDTSGVTTLLSRIPSAFSFTGAYVQAQVKGEDNLDFGALKKTSLNAATPASVGNVTAPVIVSPIQVNAGVLQKFITVTNGVPVQIVRGDTGDAATLIYNSKGLRNFTGKTVYFTAKKIAGSDNSLAIVNRAATITDTTNGVAQIVLTSAETATIGTYHAEFEMRTGNDATTAQTLSEFSLSILQDVRQ